jgi:magnesium chelatase subunit D
MGVNYVEREGVSFEHPSEFVLVGTMNPEEGELRPQLLDRFALSVEVRGIPYREARAEIVRRRVGFEADPVGFVDAQVESQQQVRDRIVAAAELLPQVKLSDEMLDLVTLICTDFAVDGHRADITIYKTACTIAAYKGRTEVTEEDVKEAAELALAHRRRRQPFEEPKMEQQQLQDTMQKWEQNKENKQQQPPPPQNDSPQNNNQDNQEDNESEQKSDDEEAPEQVFEADAPYAVKPLDTPVLDEVQRSNGGRRSKSISNSKTGRYVGSALPKGKVTDLAFDATLRVPAP